MSMITTKQGKTIWFIAPVYLDSDTELDYGGLYSRTEGVPLDNDLVGSVSFVVKHLTPLRINGVDYNKNDVAILLDTNIPASGYCVLHKDLKTPQVRIGPGLYGGADYNLKVTELKMANGLPETRIIEDVTIRVYLPV